MLSFQLLTLFSQAVLSTRSPSAYTSLTQAPIPTPPSTNKGFTRAQLDTVTKATQSTHIAARTSPGTNNGVNRVTSGTNHGTTRGPPGANYGTRLPSGNNNSATKASPGTNNDPTKAPHGTNNSATKAPPSSSATSATRAPRAASTNAMARRAQLQRQQNPTQSPPRLKNQQEQQQRPTAQRSSTVPD